MSEESSRRADLIKRVLESATVSVEGIAEEAGLSADTLWAWAAGRRNPSPQNLEKVAAVLEERGGQMTELAKELRDAAE